MKAKEIWKFFEEGSVWVHGERIAKSPFAETMV